MATIILLQVVNFAVKILLFNRNLLNHQKLHLKVSFLVSEIRHI